MQSLVEIRHCTAALERKVRSFFFVFVFSNVLKVIWTMPQGGATFVLELGQYLNFSENSKAIVCAHSFDHLKEG